MRRIVMLSAALLCATAFTTSVSAESIKDKTDRKEAAIPQCSRNLGTITVRESDTDNWTPLGLPAPDALLKVFVQKSGCFTLVDRSKAFDIAQQERELAARGALQRGSNIGKGQVRAADYVLVPAIASKNEHSGGGAVGALLTGIIGAPLGIAGAVLSEVGISSKTADVTLTVVNVRTSEDEQVEQGHGSKTDITFGGGGLGIGGGGFGAAGVSAYEHSDIGQVVILAYIQAYTKLVADMGGLPADASAAAPVQAVTMTVPGHLFVMPGKPKAIRTLAAGAILYPTGQTDGNWMQVRDEIGNLGWVSSRLVTAMAPPAPVTASN
jgi:curli biogenesis system outer membrane secretion channel CsgG